MKEKIGIGIIGTGFARRVQIPAFLACDNVFIASVASGSEENARATADEFQIAHSTTDWHETVSHPDVNLVCITTPPNLHREMTLFSIEQGKHILCEKPMAMNVAEAEEMTSAAKGMPLLALIDHELRFQPGRQLAYKMLRDGAIGKVRHVKAIFQAPSRGNPKLPWSWWSDASVGGGTLGAIGSHLIDSINWFLDAEISDVFCQLQTHIKERPNSSGDMCPVTSDDEATMLLRLSDGHLTTDATGLISMSMTEYPKYKNLLEFYGEQGSMRIGEKGELSIANAGDNDWQEIRVDIGSCIEGGPDTGFSRGFLAFAPEIITAIREKRKHIPYAATFEDGLRVQRVLDAAQQSHSEKRQIKLH